MENLARREIALLNKREPIMEIKTEPSVANYRVTTEEDVNHLFSQEFIEKYLEPNPLEENTLIEYVSTCISHQETDALKLKILLKTAAIDPLNEARNFWIIKKAFEIAPFDGKENLMKLNVVHTMSMLYGYTQQDPKGTTLERYIPLNGSAVQCFLLKLKTCIPQSPFLWFYLQYSLQPVAKGDWIQVFDAYNLENIQEVKNQIFTHFIQEWLHFTNEFNSICLKYAKAVTPLDYAYVIEACGTLFKQYEQGLRKQDGEYYLTQLIYNTLRSQTKNDNDLFEQAFTEFEQTNYNKVIELLTPVISNPDELKNHKLLVTNSMYGMLAKSHQEIGESGKALILFETVYSRIVSSNQHHYRQKEIAFDAIVCLRSKSKTNTPQTEFFKNEDTNPFVIYKQGVEKLEQKEYAEAIALLNDALAFFIPKKGLISKECLQCYSKLSFSCQQLGQLDSAYTFCNMALALAIELYLKNQIEEIKIQLEQLKTQISAQTLEEEIETKLSL